MIGISEVHTYWQIQDLRLAGAHILRFKLFKVQIQVHLTYRLETLMGCQSKSVVLARVTLKHCMTRSRFGLNITRQKGGINTSGSTDVLVVDGDARPLASSWCAISCRCHLRCCLCLKCHPTCFVWHYRSSSRSITLHKSWCIDWLKFA